MYYIVVTVGDMLKVVSDQNDIPRTFNKLRKARTFIDSRRYLEPRNPQIIENIEEIIGCFRVDL